ncbi:Imm21 family immunity protein [Acidovorax sp. SUPP2539]|uniref:Imm21 family immunity protein n=1 Tax=Acidovorax sp. SUPP2539 TaxID=2920878 RepID=UPI0023DE27AE|nr:Imm21 family immunity protein [Acidovorax sp. SUPP2539]GKS92853.1 hypothetical protein AVTE2539_25830 [Acidovorax sp. SUPP2539]
MINKWINTNGGPLVGASGNVISHWKGVDGSSSSVDAGIDYDRACSIIDFLGVVDCGGFPVVVFGDEPLQSTFVHCNDKLVVRWVSCKSYEVADKVLLEVPEQLPQLQEKLSYSQNDNIFKFFDSFFDGAQGKEEGQFDLAQGDYVLTTELYKDEGQYEFIIHRFKKND